MIGNEMKEETKVKSGLDNERQEETKLKGLIEQSVDESVHRAFKKYGKGFRPSIRNLVALILIFALVAAGVGWIEKSIASGSIAPIGNHDLTLENHGIFGFMVADFEEAILGEATRQRLLIVEEQEVYVNTTITETGLFNWGVFNKQQILTIHGTGQYTIDLTQVTADDISMNEDTYELTIRIPHAQLHETIFDQSQTEIGDTNNGWLALGEIKLTVEEQKEFEATAVEKLKVKLSEEAQFVQADKFAKLSAYEIYQPIVKKISPAYKVVIEFQSESGENE